MNSVYFTVILLSALLIFVCITGVCGDYSAGFLTENNADAEVLKYSYTAGKKWHMQTLFQSELENVLASDPAEHSDQVPSSIDGPKRQDSGVPSAPKLDPHAKEKDDGDLSKNGVLPQGDNMDGGGSGGPGGDVGTADVSRGTVQTNSPSGTGHESSVSKEQKHVETAKESTPQGNDTSDTSPRQSDTDGVETSKNTNEEMSEENKKSTKQSLSSDAVLKEDTSEEIKEDAEKSLFVDMSPTEDTSKRLSTQQPTEIKTEKANISFFVRALLALLLFLCVIMCDFVC